MNPQQRAAMQMALEALEEATTYTASTAWSPSMTKECEKAATALREALAQPQGEWVDLTEVEVDLVIDETYGESPELYVTQVRHDFSKELLAKFKEKNTPPSVEHLLNAIKSLREGIDETVEAAIEATKEKADWSNLEFQCHALQEIGAHWYDGKVRNQWIADTCHEIKKHIAAAIRSMK